MRECEMIRTGPRAFVVTTLYVCLVVLSGCHGGFRDREDTAARNDVPQVDWSVELTGSGLVKPTIFTYTQLARMEMTGLDNVLMQRTHGPDKMTSWKGVPLDALLKAAEIKPGPMVFTLEAADGYRIKASGADLESAIVALRDGDGRWLAEVDQTRPLQLVAPRKTGDYWLRNLGKITVEPDD